MSAFEDALSAQNRRGELVSWALIELSWTVRDEPQVIEPAKAFDLLKPEELVFPAPDLVEVHFCCIKK